MFTKTTKKLIWKIVYKQNEFIMVKDKFSLYMYDNFKDCNYLFE